MKIIALTTAAFLAAAGSAFAANFHSNETATPPASVDSTYTSSIPSVYVAAPSTPVDWSAQEHRSQWGD